MFRLSGLGSLFNKHSDKLEIFSVACATNWRTCLAHFVHIFCFSLCFVSSSNTEYRFIDTTITSSLSCHGSYNNNSTRCSKFITVFGRIGSTATKSLLRFGSTIVHRSNDRSNNLFVPTRTNVKLSTNSTSKFNGWSWRSATAHLQFTVRRWHSGRSLFAWCRSIAFLSKFGK